MATIITAASASISPSSLTILSHQRSPPPKPHPFRFTSTHHRTLSHSAPPKTPLTVSGNTAVSSVSPSSPNKNAKPIIVIDNYDSFTYNLCQYMGELGCEFEVYRNDELTVDDLKEKNPRGILISPGPGTPQDSGISLRTVLELGPTVPLFGVCMGLQCIGEAFGGAVYCLGDLQLIYLKLHDQVIDNKLKGELGRAKVKIRKERKRTRIATLKDAVQIGGHNGM